MSHRRVHTKSRHGCVQCKRSKLKCDEVRPSCGRCVKKGETCSLLHSESSLIIIPTSQSKAVNGESIFDDGPRPESTATTTPATSIDSDPPVHRKQSYGGLQDDTHFSTTERDNLRLMNHFTASTWQIVTEPELAINKFPYAWRDHIPQLSFEHDYLLHGLLGMASLHLALTSSSPQQKHSHTVLATHHHNLGLAQFRSALGSITESTIQPLFAFSCFLTIYSFGIRLSTRSALNPLAKIHEVFALLRGTGVIVKSGLHWLLQSPLSATMMILPSDPNRPLPAVIEAVLATLTNRIESTISTSAHAAVYTAAIATLRSNLIVAHEQPQAKMAIVLFPIMAPAEFMSLLCIGERLALAIVANYAVILYRLRGQIWLEGWGKEVVEAVRGALSGEWRDCVAWAVEEVGD